MSASRNSIAIIGRWPFYAALLFTLLPLGAGPEGAAEGSSLRQVVWGLIFLSAALVFVRQPSRLQQAIDALPSFFLLLLFYVSASFLWSSEPYVSFKRVVQVVGVVVLGASLVAGGNGSYRIHRLITPVLGVSMLLSIAATALFPDYAFSDLGFRAFMATKNNFGQFAAYAVIFSVACLVLENKHKYFYAVLAFCGIGGLILSHSMTAAASLASVLALFLLRWLRLNTNRAGWQALIGLGLTGLVCLHLAGIIFGYPSVEDVLEFIFRATGRDVTLSGRTYLWELMLNQIQNHPWFGTGYGGFWLGLEGMSGQIAYLVKWGYPGQAHNGYLDILNELGVIGMLLVIGFIVQHGINLVRLSAIDSRLAFFHGMLLVALLAMNVAEATILRTTHLWWIVFVASVFEVGSIIHQPISRSDSIALSSKTGVIHTRGTA